MQKCFLNKTKKLTHRFLLSLIQPDLIKSFLLCKLSTSDGFFQSRNATKITKNFKNLKSIWQFVNVKHFVSHFKLSTITFNLYHNVYLVVNKRNKWSLKTIVLLSKLIKSKLAHLFSYTFQLKELCQLDRSIDF